jgi:hypothetical protein
MGFNEQVPLKAENLGTPLRERRTLIKRKEIIL